MGKKFSLLVMDPPYGFQDKLEMDNIARGAEANYNTLNNNDILSLPIKDISDPNGSVLALWVPSSLLDFGIKLMEGYGYDLKQTWIWVKLKNDPFKSLKKDIKNNKDIDWDNINFDNFLSFGMGRLGRNVHEICLMGIRGKPYKSLENKSQRTVFHFKNEKHSKKPEELQNRLELMFPQATINNSAIEIFARRERDGWVTIGNEVGNKEDIRVSLQKLINQI